MLQPCANRHQTTLSGDNELFAASIKCSAANISGHVTSHVTEYVTGDWSFPAYVTGHMNTFCSTDLVTGSRKDFRIVPRLSR